MSRPKVLPSPLPLGEVDKQHEDGEDPLSHLR